MIRIAETNGKYGYTPQKKKIKKNVSVTFLYFIESCKVNLLNFILPSFQIVKYSSFSKYIVLTMFLLLLFQIISYNF